MNLCTKEKIRKYTEFFVDIDENQYVIMPMMFSPLYCHLYTCLLKNKEPVAPFECNHDINVITADMMNCNNTFDRYLIALYSSPYELSYPIPLTNEQATETNVIKYLNDNYGVYSTERDSFNFGRDNKEILEIFSDPLKDRFRKNKHNRSIWTKLLTFNQKMSAINRQWKSLVCRAKDMNHRAYLDNIIPHNGIDHLKSRENSAIFMTFYFELDQGRPDGDENYSRLLPITPFAQELLEKRIKSKVIDCWGNLYDEEQTYEEVEEFILNGLAHINKKYKENKDTHLKYNDHNSEFYDYLLGQVVQNLAYNTIVAKKNFEETLLSDTEWRIHFNYLVENSTWIQNKLNRDEFITLVAEKLSIEHCKINGEICELTDVIVSIFAKRLRTMKIEELNNIVLYVITALKHIWPSEIKGSIKGAKDQFYHVYNELSGSFSRLKFKNAGDHEIESFFRPSLLHFLELCIDLVSWSKNKTATSLNKFIRLRRIIHKSLGNSFTLLESQHHYEFLRVVQYLEYGFISNVDNNDDGIANLLNSFWSEADPDTKALSTHIDRVKCTWPRCS